MSPRRYMIEILPIRRNTLFSETIKMSPVLNILQLDCYGNKTHSQHHLDVVRR